MLPAPISEPFARILAAGRPLFNAKVAETRRRAPEFETDAFSTVLAGPVNRLVCAVAAACPERAATVAVAAFDAALILVSQGLLGPRARYPLVDRVWTELAPSLVSLLAHAPNDVLGALSNAAIYLQKTPGTRGDEWLSRMQALAPRAGTLPQLLAIGQIAAWLAGAAHFRAGALTAADALPPPLALAALGADPGSEWNAVRSNLLADPWWTPGLDRRLPRSREVGAFTGFGGAFARPPEVRAAGDGFWVRSGSRHHLLIADAWGAVLQPATADEFALPAPPAGPAPSARDARLVFPYGAVELDLPSAGLCLVCNAHTAAVTSPFTHAIRLFPLR